MKKIKKITILVMMLILCLYTTGCEEVRAASASMDLSDIMTYTGNLILSLMIMSLSLKKAITQQRPLRITARWILLEDAARPLQVSDRN